MRRPRRLERIGRRDVEILAALLVVSACVWGFLELADAALEGETRGIDEWALRFFRDPEAPSRLRGPRFLFDVTRDLTALGGTTVLTLVTAIVAIGLYLQRRRAATVLVLAATIGGAAVSSLLKLAIGRERPQVVPPLVDVLSSSFPSGHAMSSAVVYLTLGVLVAQLCQGFVLRSYVIGASIFVTLLVGLSRVALGVHFLTDVVAGWTAGLAWALLCLATMRWIEHRRGDLGAR